MLRRIKRKRNFPKYLETVNSDITLLGRYTVEKTLLLFTKCGHRNRHRTKIGVEALVVTKGDEEVRSERRKVSPS